jgi:methyltransferase (TIGR00027 family)
MSKTAQLVALARAVGALERNGELRNPDYLARHFLTGAHRLALWPGIRELLKAVSARRISPGMYEYHTARTRFIDGVLDAAILRRIPQIVILGAGLDSRAYRFAQRIGHATVYEVDRQGQTQAKQRLLRNLGTVPDNVRYVAVDFTRAEAAAALRAQGWDPGRQSLFICEGLFYYLPQEAVDGLFRTMATAAAGTRLVFDYVRAAVLANPEQHHGAPEFLSLVARHGEPVRSSFAEVGLEKIIGQYGFRLQTHLFGQMIPEHVWGGNPPLQMRRMCDIFGLTLAIRGH